MLKKYRIYYSFVLFGLFFTSLVFASPPAVEIETSKEFGPLQFHDVILGRDGGFSALFDGKSVWVFGDTSLNIEGHPGSSWRSSTWCWTRDLNAGDGITGLNEPLDKEGAPFEFIPFMPVETADTRRNNLLKKDNRSRWALWPGPITVDPKTKKAFVFYQKIRAKSGPFNFKNRGSSIATWDSPGTELKRHPVSPETDLPTILFSEDDIPMGNSALAAGKWFYAFGWSREGYTWPCIAGRVLFSEALKREAWQFYAGNGKWVKDWKRAVSVIEAAPMFSVQWNDYFGRYIAIYSAPFKNTVHMRTAAAIEGPWSAPILIHEALPPKDDSKWCYAGLGHQEFTREKGRIIYLTYFRPSDGFKGETRLVEISFK